MSHALRFVSQRRRRQRRRQRQRCCLHAHNPNDCELQPNHRQEKAWQEDTRLLLAAADAKAADILERSLAAQRSADAAEAEKVLENALAQQQKKCEH